MRRNILCVLVAMAVIVLVAGVSAVVDVNYAVERDEVLIKSIHDLAMSIIRNNKYAFEQAWKGKELEYYDWDDHVKHRYKASWDRVWAKVQTIVIASAAEKKNNFQLEESSRQILIIFLPEKFI